MRAGGRTLYSLRPPDRDLAEAASLLGREWGRFVRDPSSALSDQRAADHMEYKTRSEGATKSLR
jgi:hypothetical protein